MIYVLLKALHILALTLFFGAGLGSVTLKLWADRSGDIDQIVFASHAIVRADWLFTIPSAILLPATGLGMVWYAGYPLNERWILGGLVLYATAGLTWLPAWRLQFKMEAAARAAQRDGTPLPPEYHRWTRTWALLGVPSFFSVLTAVLLMVGKGVVTG